MALDAPGGPTTAFRHLATSACRTVTSGQASTRGQPGAGPASPPSGTSPAESSSTCSAPCSSPKATPLSPPPWLFRSVSRETARVPTEILPRSSAGESAQDWLRLVTAHGPDGVPLDRCSLASTSLRRRLQTRPRLDLHRKAGRCLDLQGVGWQRCSHCPTCRIGSHERGARLHHALVRP